MRIIKDSNSLLPQRKCGSLDIHWLIFTQTQETKRCLGGVCFENNSYPRWGTREPIRSELGALRSKAAVGLEKCNNCIVTFPMSFAKSTQFP